jgi:hypothetical protein
VVSISWYIFLFLLMRIFFFLQGLLFPILQKAMSGQVYYIFSLMGICVSFWKVFKIAKKIISRANIIN